jgi:protease-4
VAWLIAEKKIKGELPVRDYKLTPRFGDLTFLRTAASITFDALGLGAVARRVEQAGMAQAVDRLGLDGMLALWQPAGTN